MIINEMDSWNATLIGYRQLTWVCLDKRIDGSNTLLRIIDYWVIYGDG